MDKNTKHIYDTLKQGGANVGSEKEFNDWFYAPGKRGYQNRLSIYKALKQGGDAPERNYEEFKNWLGLHAVSPSGTATSRQAVKLRANSGRTTARPWRQALGVPENWGKIDMGANQPQYNYVNGKYDPITAGRNRGKAAQYNPNKPQRTIHEQKQQEEAFNAALQSEADKRAERMRREGKNDAQLTRADLSNRAAMGDAEANAQLGMPQKMQQYRDQMDNYELTGNATLEPKIQLNEVKDKNGNVVQPGLFAPVLARDPYGNVLTDDNGNPMVDATTDEAARSAYNQIKQGNIENKRAADAEYNLEKAYAERDKLNEAIKKRMDEIDKEHGSVGEIIMEAMASNRGSLNPAGNMLKGTDRYSRDPTYQMLMAAARKNDDAIQVMEDVRDGKTNSFWHSMGEEITNGYNFSGGMTDAKDLAAQGMAKGEIETINKKINAGKPLSSYEQAALAVVRNFNNNDEVHSRLDSKFGLWHDAGDMAVQSAEYMLDFILSPGAPALAKAVMKGVMKAGLKAGGKALVKQMGESAAKKALKAVGRGVLRATGVGASWLTAGAYVSNVGGGMHTLNGIEKNYLGNVSRDAGGMYHINGGMSLGKSIYEGERDAIGQNGSEIFGELLKMPRFVGKAGGKLMNGLVKSKLGQKLKLSNIQQLLVSAHGSDWYKAAQKVLEAGGYNGTPGEIMEEYANIGYDALTGHWEDAKQQITDPRNNYDIILGCATTGAFMGALPMLGAGAHVGMYFKYKHGMKKADAKAQHMLTPGVWAGIKDKIDNTSNTDMADLAVNLMMHNRDISNNDKDGKKRQAVWDYIVNLQKMRGYNLAQENYNKTHKPNAETQQQEEAYAEGYNTTDAKQMSQLKAQLAAAEQNLRDVFGGSAYDGHLDAQQVLDARNEDGAPRYSDEARQAAQYVLNTQQKYEGMLQSVRDGIDNEVAAVQMETDARTNQETGKIQSATLKVQDEKGQDRKVYITNGYVATRPDGSIDVKNSDPTLITVDENGKVEMMSPDQLLKLDAPVDAEQAKREAVENVRQTKAQEAADKIDGVAVDEQPADGQNGPIDGQNGQTVPEGQSGPAATETDTDTATETDTDNAAGAEPVVKPMEAEGYDAQGADVMVQGEDGQLHAGNVTAYDNTTDTYMVQTADPVNGKTLQPFNKEQLFVADENGQNGPVDGQGGPIEGQNGQTVPEGQQSQDTPATADNSQRPAEQPQRAIDRIPSQQVDDGKGGVKTVHQWEQAEPGDTYDALSEIYHGNADRVKRGVTNRIKKIDDGIKKVQKQMEAIDNSDDFDAVAAQSEQYDQLLEQKKQLEEQWKYWKNVQNVPDEREAEKTAKQANNKQTTTDKDKEEDKENEESEKQSAENPQQAVTNTEAKDNQNDEKIQLSDEVDENGRQFVLSPNGSLSFGHLGKQEGLPDAPILLTHIAADDGID